VTATRTNATNSSSPQFRAGLMIGRVTLLIAALATLLFTALQTDERIVVYGTAVISALVYFVLFTLTAPGDSYLGLGSGRLGPWVLAYATVTFGIASLSIPELAEETNAALQLADVPIASGIALAGFSAFVLGYRSSYRATPPGTRGNLKLSDHGAILAYVFGVTAVALTYMSTGALGYLGDDNGSVASGASPVAYVLALVAKLRFIGLSVLAYRVFQSSSHKLSLVLTVMVLGEFAFAIFSAIKENFILLAVAILFAYLRSRRKMPFIGIVTVVAAYILIVSPAVSVVRDIAQTGGTRQSVGETIQQVQERSLVGEVASEQEDSASTVLRRLSLLPNVQLISELTPSLIDYRDSREILAAPIAAMVPRAIWADKPVYNDGQQFYTNYWKGTTASSSAITTPGSFLLYGPMPLMVVGMGLFGIVVARLDNMAQASGDVAVLLLAAVLFSPVVKQEMDIAGILRNIAGYAMLFWIGWCLVLRRRARYPSSGGAPDPIS